MENPLNLPSSKDGVTFPQREKATLRKPLSALPPEQLKKLKEQKEEELPHWFAMRATYRIEQIMKEKLKDKGIESFVPLIIKEKTIAGKRKRYWAPAINSLIFVYGIKQRIQDFKVKEPRLQYQCRKTLDGRNVPIIVPDEQMQAFISLYTSGNCEISEIEESFTPGQRVRIISGPFEGMTGTLQRVRGHRDKRFVVAIKGVALISTTMVEPNMIVPI